MSDELGARLRAALQAADYTYDSVAGLLGPEAHLALSRNETTPGLGAAGGGSATETLTRLWLLQATVPTTAAEAALPGLVDQLCAAGILERSISEVAARVDLRPYGTDAGADLWVASDLTPGLDGAPQRVDADHVLGISPAATSLAELTARTPVARALDLGTGCGVQSLHLATHVDGVVATDVNSRALWLAGLNADLNEIELDLRQGSFFDPVAREDFDLIVTNPPFVISPATGERLVYRDSGLPGDRAVEHIVRTAPGHLVPGGLCQVLANWLILDGEPWQDRLAGWMAGSSDTEQAACDAWVVQRELVDLPTYVELWLKDAGLHPSTGNRDVAEYRRRYDTWLSWFDEIGARAVGFGWINLRRTDAEPRLRLEEWPYEVAQPLGAEVVDHFARVDVLRGLDDAGLAAARLTLRPDVRQETLGAPGAEDPGQIVLRQQIGIRRARQVDTAEAAFVGACDGELTVGQLLAAVEQLTGSTVSTDTVRELVEEGFLSID